MRVNFLVNYGWEWDLGHLQAPGCSRRQIVNGLRSRDVSRVDLLIRWGGRRRLSGFLPVQAVYADFFVVDRLWPDFRPGDLAEALSWYKSRISPGRIGRGVMPCGKGPPLPVPGAFWRRLPGRRQRVPRRRRAAEKTAFDFLQPASISENHSRPNKNIRHRTPNPANTPSIRLLFGVPVHKEIGKRRQFLFLGYIDIQRLVRQPVVGVNADVAFLVGVNQKRIGGVFIAVAPGGSRHGGTRWGRRSRTGRARWAPR